MHKFFSLLKNVNQENKKCIGGLSVNVRCEIMLSVSEGKTWCLCVCVCMCMFRASKC